MVSASGRSPLISRSIQIRLVLSCAIIFQEFSRPHCVISVIPGRCFKPAQPEFPHRMNTFAVVFLLALLVTVAMRLWLARRHVAHIQAHRSAVPTAFTSEISLEAHQKAADY